MLTRILSPAIVAVMLSLTAGSFAQAQSRPRETIQVGLIDRTFFLQPVFVAIQNGYLRRRGPQRQHPLHPQRRRPGRRPDQGRSAFRAVVGRRHHPERRARRAAAHDRGELRQAQPFHHHAEESSAKVEDLKGGNSRHPHHDRRQLLQLAGDRAEARPEISRRLQGACRPRAPARAIVCWSTARSTSACNRSRGPMSPRMRASTISAPRPTMCRSGSSRSTTSTANGRRPMRGKVEGFLRAILRATDWIYRNRARPPRSPRARLNIKPAYAERAWDYLHQDRYADARPVVHRSRASQGVRDADQGRAAAGGRANSTCRNMSASDYLKRARATVPKD